MSYVCHSKTLMLASNAGGAEDTAVQDIVWHASDRRPAPIVANSSVERLGLAQWDADALPFAALVSHYLQGEACLSAQRKGQQRH